MWPSWPSPSEHTGNGLSTGGLTVLSGFRVGFCHDSLWLCMWLGFCWTVGLEGLVDHSAACTSCCILVPEADAHHADWLCCNGMGMVGVTLLIPGRVFVGFCLTGLT